MRVFYTQLNEFCQMMQEEVVARLEDLAALPTSPGKALAFTESLMLCPTPESARSCIQKDLGGALSFLLALDGINTRIQKECFELPRNWPEYQTRYYVLACAVQQYIDSLHAQAA